MVKSVVQDTATLKARRSAMGSKSVGELSQITGFSDFPIPGAIERLMQKRDKSVDAPDNVSTVSMHSSTKYGTLPKSLQREMLVRSRMEDPEILKERRAVTQAKSVNELSQITNL